MATGGVHILSANAGSMDRILLASDLLYKRIEHIRKVRQQMGKCNTAPTLRDIEKSHILFVNAHFKPFAAIAQEYERVNAQSGTAAYNSTVTFSIPQFGDFFADMAGRIRINAVECNTVALVNGSTTQLTSLASANYPGLVYSAPGVLAGTVDYVDYLGNVIADDAGVVALAEVGGSFSAQNHVKYCDFPGLRILRGVRFTVNGNPLDQYTSNISAFYEKFLISTDKRVGFSRLVGQEVPIESYSGGDLNVVGQASLPQYAVSTDTSRRLTAIANGPQTPKPLQPALTLMVPHWFWFCKDTRLAIPSVSIPYGQRFVEWDFATQNQIQYVVPGNVFIRQVLVGVAAAAGVVAQPAVVNTLPYLVPGSTLSTGNNNGAIADVVLFVNNLFMQSEVHDIFIDRVGFNLIRVHRTQTLRLTGRESEELLNQMKWPIETIFAGVRPVSNTDDTNVDSATQWNKFGRISSESSRIVDRQYASANTAGAIAAVNTTLVEARDSMTYQILTPVMQSLSVTSHGNVLWQELPTVFYNAYAPFQFGGGNIMTPKDEGAVMVNFALYPGSYQPSGHLNISRSREFHFNVTALTVGGTDLISTSAPAELVVYGVAINFLLVSDGSAVIRYST